MLTAKEARINRLTAIAMSAKTYLGRPCRNCGCCEKVTKWSECVKCRKIKGMANLNNSQLMEKYRTPEKEREKLRKWRQDNPEKVKEQAIRCRAKQRHYQVLRRKRVKEQTPADADMKLIMEFYVKAEQMEKETGIKYEVDHIHPIKLGGLHHQNNLQILTRTENRKKGGK